MIGSGLIKWDGSPAHRDNCVANDSQQENS